MMISTMLLIVLLLASSDLNRSFNPDVIVKRAKNFGLIHGSLKFLNGRSQPSIFCSTAHDTEFHVPSAPKRSGYYSRPDPSEVNEATVVGDVVPSAAITEQKVKNSKKEALLLDVKTEESRLTELDTLLDAFYSIIEEKEQIIAIEEELLSAVLGIRGKVSDSLLTDLDTTSSDSIKMLGMERECCKNISLLASNLAVEIYDTKEMIAQTQKIVLSLPDFIDDENSPLDSIKQKTYIEMRPLLLSFRTKRDLRVLNLISQLNAACGLTGQLSNNAVSDQIGASVGASVGAVAREIYAITSSDPSTPIAVSPELDLLKKDVEQKSNAELALTVSKAAGITLKSLVSITSGFITASFNVARSAEVKISFNSTSSALSVFGGSLSKAISVVRTAFKNPKAAISATEKTNLIDDIRNVLDNSEVKLALGELSESSTRAKDETFDSIAVTTSLLQNTLYTTPKWRKAVAELLDSLSLLLAALTLSGKRVLGLASSEKQLPDAQ